MKQQSEGTHQSPTKQKDPSKKIKNIRRIRKPSSKAFSRQFNNPIYAGFENMQENKELDNWGPWVIRRQFSPIKRSQSQSPQKFRSSEIKFNKKSQTDLLATRKSEQIKVPSIRELPQIKEYRKEEIKQVRFNSLELLPRDTEVCQKFSPSKNKKAKILLDQKRIKYELELHEEFMKKIKNLGQVQVSTKIRPVVYNYCTDHNSEGSLLQFHRKKPSEAAKLTGEQNVEAKEKRNEKGERNSRLFKYVNSYKYLY